MTEANKKRAVKATPKILVSDGAKKFLKDSSAKKHHPALGEATISGLLVIADQETGLAKKVQPIIYGGTLESIV